MTGRDETCMARKAEAFDKICALLFGYSDNEGTGHPWWAVVRRGSFGRMIVLAGPFFSRERAEGHRKAREYEYTSKSFVYCFSGHSSCDYIELRDIAIELYPFLGTFAGTKASATRA